LHIYGTETIEDGLKEALGSPLPEGLVFHSVEVFHPFEADEIEVVPVKASHKANELCLNYAFMSGGKGFLQAFDTGWYPDDTWNALRGLLLDAAIIECTAGKLDEPPIAHLGVKTLIQMKEKLIEERALRDNARVIATHLCHMGGLLHEELEQALLPAGIEVAYDGMLVET
jgi:phosphoribosyl 1,2-cyclic phosphate phosphodiesterase